ncbi:MAG: hypothetical protein NVSMB70_05110 [Chamaesiphon sp.]
MSLFDSEPRSASISTLAACDCLMLTQLQLYDAIDETPGIAINIIRLLSHRIRELNQKVNSFQAKIKEPTFKNVGLKQERCIYCATQSKGFTVFSKNFIWLSVMTIYRNVFLYVAY